jgi:molybdate transport system substrate-binding protein
VLVIKEVIDMPTALKYIRSYIHSLLIACLITLTLSGISYAGQVRVAVASNFLLPLRSMMGDFEKQTGNIVHISSGSTGKLYAQIINGAPFDVFLAANSREPQRLEEAGMVVKGSRFTYALGQLALWGPGLNASTIDFEAALTLPTVQRISVANPQTAPYGAAAIETLKKLGIYDSLKAKIINGENVSQSYQYVASGATQLGFVALSQIKARTDSEADAAKHYWVVDKSVYSPIRQQAVLVKGAENNKAAKQFIAYLKSPQGRAAIKSFGYSIEGQ